MKRRGPQLPQQMQEVVSYQDDVYTWLYLDQVDGLLRYEAFVIGYDQAGNPTTLELVIEEGAFELTEFPQLTSLLPRHLREQAENPSKHEDVSLTRFLTGQSLRFGEQTPWDLTSRQWERLHRFCAEQETRLKRECRLRWTRRLRALGYDVIESL